MPLDRATLRTPRRNGDLLIEPPAPKWRYFLHENQRILGSATVRVGDQSLAVIRAQIRTDLVGGNEQPVIVLGHQPEFFHPGIWAKHILADRFARDIGGLAVNLVVDNDVLKSPSISIPQQANGHWSTMSIRLTSGAATSSYEFLPALSSLEVTRLEEDFRRALGAAYPASAVPIFFDGLRLPQPPRDWVVQSVAGRRAVDHAYGIELLEHRVSAIDFAPLILETVIESRRFAAAYNDALNTYRIATGIRDSRRPMPDLEISPGRTELPWWAVRAGISRQRVFLVERHGVFALMAEGTAIVELSQADLISLPSFVAAWARQSAWGLRPRAITLTLWARLLLADFFVHGIGGAKYDAVCDAIIERYFGIRPPQFAAVSATLRWAPAAEKLTDIVAVDPQQLVRDARYNPQRHFPINGSAAGLFVERKAAIEAAENLARLNPKHRLARRSAFQRIHDANAAILEHHAELWRQLESRYVLAAQELQHAQIPLGRDYFFAAYPTTELQKLVAALSAVADFAV